MWVFLFINTEYLFLAFWDGHLRMCFLNFIVFFILEIQKANRYITQC